MDPDRFEAFLRAFATPPTRRDALRLVACAVAATFLDSAPQSSGAKKKGSKGKGGNKKKKKKPTQGPSASDWFGAWQVFHGTALDPVGDLSLHGDPKGPTAVTGLWNDTQSPAHWLVEGETVGADAQTLVGGFTTLSPVYNALVFSVQFANPEKTRFLGYYYHHTTPDQHVVFGGFKT